MVGHYATDLDAETFVLPAVKPEHAPLLRQALAEHQASLTPAQPKEVERMLLALRSATKVTTENASEAEASFKILIAHMLDVPKDILREALRRYVDAPGKRFFPRSPGELNTFIWPLTHERSRRIYRLKRLAEEAERLQAEHARLSAPVEEIPLEEIRTWTPSYRQTALNQGWITQAQFDAIAPEPPPVA